MQLSFLQYPALKTLYILVSLDPQHCILKPGDYWALPGFPSRHHGLEALLRLQAGARWGSSHCFLSFRDYHYSLPACTVLRVIISYNLSDFIFLYKNIFRIFCPIFGCFRQVGKSNPCYFLLTSNQKSHTYKFYM